MRLRTLFTGLSAGVLWLGLAALLVAGAANAASISYYLNQTNTTFLPDGTNYLTITFADSTAAPGDIDVTVTLLSPLTGIAGANFGIQTFSFSSTNTLSAANIIGLPSSSWAADFAPPPQVADGFGQFGVEVADTGMDRQDPTLSFSISIAGDSIDDYAVLSGGNAGEGNTYFAAHVAGFLDQDPDPEEVLTSAWFGGSTIVPEPSTVLLVVAGLALLGLRRRG